MDKRLTARLYRRFLHKYFLNDLYFDLRLAAKAEAVAYIQTHMTDAMMFRDRFEQLAYAAKHISVSGLILEFGVEKGASLRLLAKESGQTVHGFDSFQGLPADWTGTYETKGKFSLGGRAPKMPENAQLHQGWFEDSLPGFLESHTEPVALLHVDCDIYASAKTVFDKLGERIVPGTIIVFDEYFNYPNWRQHEFKAFQEFIELSRARYRYIGFSTEKGHVAIQID
jgi:hypothetical protein